MLRLNQIATLTGIALTYAGALAHAEDIVPEPQLVKDAWMLETFFEADADAIRAVLPPGLKPHPSNTVVVNMYTVPDAAATNGLGAYTLSYIAVQVAGHDSYIYGTKDTIPGLYFVHYWNSSDTMRAYTKRAGIPDDQGGTTTLQKDANKVTTRLSVNGKPFIEASSNIAGDAQAAAGGHTNYLAGKGGQVKKMPLPWICQEVKSENATISFQMPSDHPAYKLRPKKVTGAFFAGCTISYPQTVAVKP